MIFSHALSSILCLILPTILRIELPSCSRHPFVVSSDYLLAVHFSFVGMFSPLSLSATSFSFRVASTKKLSRESSHSPSVSCSRAICVDLCCCGIQCIIFSHLSNLFVALSNTFCAFVVALLRFCIFSFLSCPRTFSVSQLLCVPPVPTFCPSPAIHILLPTT